MTNSQPDTDQGIYVIAICIEYNPHHNPIAFEVWLIVKSMYNRIKHSFNNWEVLHRRFLNNQSARSLLPGLSHFGAHKDSSHSGIAILQKEINLVRFVGCQRAEGMCQKSCDKNL